MIKLSIFSVQMLFSNISLLLDYTLQYVLSNFTCIFYTLDTLNIKYLFFSGYYDLLVDISEGFGIWIVLLVLTSSSLTLTVLIQQFNMPTTLGTTKSLYTSYSKNAQTNSTRLLSYKNFLRFIPQIKITKL
jgi:hypothetical protein